VLDPVARRGPIPRHGIRVEGQRIISRQDCSRQRNLSVKSVKSWVQSLGFLGSIHRSDRQSTTTGRGTGGAAAGSGIAIPITAEEALLVVMQDGEARGHWHGMVEERLMFSMFGLEFEGPTLLGAGLVISRLPALAPSPLGGSEESGQWRPAVPAWDCPTHPCCPLPPCAAVSSILPSSQKRDSRQQTPTVHRRRPGDRDRFPIPQNHHAPPLPSPCL
jgi:hypothetical protein